MSDTESPTAMATSPEKDETTYNAQKDETTYNAQNAQNTSKTAQLLIEQMGGQSEYGMVLNCYIHTRRRIEAKVSVWCD
jgi:hypothetical protein